MPENKAGRKTPKEFILKNLLLTDTGTHSDLF